MKLQGKETNGVPSIQSRLLNLYFMRTALSFQNFVTELTNEIQNFLQADFAAFYLLDEGEGDYCLVSTTSENHKFPERINTTETGDPCRLLSSHYVIARYKARPLVLPLGPKTRRLGYIMLQQSPYTRRSRGELITIASEVTKYLVKAESYYTAHDEKKKYELLYNITSKIHSSIDMDGVLKEVISTLRKVHPEYHYYLSLSQNHNASHDLPVRELSYEGGNSNRASTRAYLTGEWQVEVRTKEKQSYLYAPLKGKQGVYGVLQIVAPSYLFFAKKDIELFVQIANTAGNALENARLYQHSRELVNDLQLINETAHKLSSNMRLTEKITYMTSQISDFCKADEVGFLSFHQQQSNKYSVLKGSTAFFNNLSGESRDVISKIDQFVLVEKEPVFIGDLRTRIHSEVDFPYKSVMAVPMIDHEQLNGLTIVLHREPYFFSFESFKLLQSLVHHSTLAFANAMLREELEKTVITDYLTKLHSRNHLEECVIRHLELDQQGSFFLFDIDNFKQINDSFGHQTGDEVIKQVSDVMKQEVGINGLAARWGGEELAIYMPGFMHEEALLLAESIRGRVAHMTEPLVTVSCGICSWIDESKPSAKSLVQQADKALYRAKKSGKNQICSAPVQEHERTAPK
ncbi:sensor domain-containing diguanylate cyclase [Halobacillus amylolyticus]|uniref:Diguanylate cyclase n=1 Tax=Halobacillus amylolyticus TaxID=2932259 RepID=A0ABY4HCD1_9BACI|nr:diguanylate cyclase [Halobacillus amylolyticus]UOR11913.1 diguanylate cyclase [Halobacillus amylolyticus]